MSNRISPGLWNLAVFALCSAGQCMNSQVPKLKRRKKSKCLIVGWICIFASEEMKYKEELVFSNSLKSSNLF